MYEVSSLDFDFGIWILAKGWKAEEGGALVITR